MTNDNKMSFTDRQIHNSDAVHFFGFSTQSKRYDEWLNKSSTKVNPHSFAGKFLKVSFWLAVIISIVCAWAIVAGAFGSSSVGGMTEAGQLKAKATAALTIPFFIVTAIQILRHKYYGLFKLLWLFPLVMWAVIISAFGFAMLQLTDQETYKQLLEQILAYGKAKGW